MSLLENLTLPLAVLFHRQTQSGMDTCVDVSSYNQLLHVNGEVAQINLRIQNYGHELCVYMLNK